LEGDDVEEIRDHMRDLGYIPPQVEELRELSESMARFTVLTDEVRELHGVLFFDESCPSRDSMYKIVEEADVRVFAEKLLLDRVPAKAVATILTHKFDARFDIKSVEMFIKGFWDVIGLSPLDFYAYFQSGGKKPPRVQKSGSIDERGAITAWEHGVHPDEKEFSVESMLRSVTVDSFFQFKKNQSVPTPEKQDQARKWAGTFMRAASAKKMVGTAEDKKKANDIRPILVYSTEEPPTLEELHRQNAESNLGMGGVFDEAAGQKSEK
jgi:hypothetical protein